MRINRIIIIFGLGVLCMFESLHAEKSEWEQLEEAFEHANSLVIKGDVEEIRAIKDTLLIQNGKFRKRNLLIAALEHDQLEIADQLMSDGDGDYWLGVNPSEKFPNHSVFLYQSLKKYYPKQWERFKNKWLIGAIETGDDKGISYLIEEEASLVELGADALRMAAFKHDIDTVKRLAALGVESDAGTLQVAFNAKSFEVLEFLDEDKLYSQEILKFEKQFPMLRNHNLLGVWDVCNESGGWGMNSLTVRENATGMIGGGIGMDLGCVYKETERGLKGYFLNMDSGEIFLEKEFELLPAGEGQAIFAAEGRKILLCRKEK